MKARPPLTRLTHTFPFEKLEPADFERLWPVEREGYERAEADPQAGALCLGRRQRCGKFHRDGIF